MAMTEILLTIAECDQIIKIIESYNNGRTLKKAYWDIYGVFHNSRRPQNQLAVIEVKSPNYDDGWVTVTMDYIDEEISEAYIFHMLHNEENGTQTEVESATLNDFLFLMEAFRDRIAPPPVVTPKVKASKKAAPKMDKLEVKAVKALGVLEDVIGDMADEITRLQSILKAAGIKY